MAFTPLTSADIVAGKPVKQELWTLTKDNFDDHESRIVSLQASVATPPPLVLGVQGPGYNVTTPSTNLCVVRIPYNITLSPTNARLFIHTAGTSGTLEIDVQRSAAGGGAFSSIFSTRPSIGFASGSYAISTNGVVSYTGLVTGDILRLDIVTAQAGDVDDFYVYLQYGV